MDYPAEFTAIELCAGYGGIHLGLKRVITNLRTIAHSEIEAFACANLVAKMEAGLLDAAPIWTDIKTFPADGFFGKVHLIAGGYPCQPFSLAGQRAGADDPRHLWPHIRRIVRAIRPLYVFWENVEGHVSLGLSTVISDMGEDGYDSEWGVFSASECGAPHQRKRVFILGKLADSPERESYGRKRNDMAEAPGIGRCLSSAALGERARTSRSAGECSGDRWPSRPGEPQHGWEPPRTILAHGENPGIVRRYGAQTDAGEINGGRRRNRDVQRGYAESPLGGNADGYPAELVQSTSRTDELRLLGNGVVPAVAALAWKVLTEKLNSR